MRPEIAMAAGMSAEGGLSALGPVLWGDVGECAELVMETRALRRGDRGDDGPRAEEAEVTEVVMRPPPPTMLSAGGPDPTAVSSSRSKRFSGTGGAAS